MTHHTAPAHDSLTTLMTHRTHDSLTTLMATPHTHIHSLTTLMTHHTHRIDVSPHSHSP